jgi:hypothetical protein
MILLFLLSFKIHAAELPTSRIRGNVSSFDEEKICLSNIKKKICIHRSKSNESLINQRGQVEIIVHKDEIINGDK